MEKLMLIRLQIRIIKIRNWITLGIKIEIAELFQSMFTSELVINQIDAKGVELVKYMENRF